MYRKKIIILVAIAACAFGIAANQVNDSISLREYVDMRFAEMQRATDTAYRSMADKLVGMNEIRGSLSDANKTFARLDAVEKMQEDIKTLRSLSDVAQGKASQSSLFFVGMISILSLAIQISKFIADRKKGQ
ncbi:MAG: hypothetical protein WC455_29495 [Dehalococcoidia bacterium]|jgi:hypothetical protein